MSIFQSLLGLHGSPLTYLIIASLTLVETTVVVGFALPGTTLFIFAGILCSRGILHLEYVIAIIALAGSIGSAYSYLLGQYGGAFVKNKKLIREDRLLRAESFFKHYGEWSVLIAQFVGPLRPIIPFVAGLFKTPRRKFLIVNSLSALGSAIFYVSLGYFFGRRWLYIVRSFSHYEIPLILGLILIGILILLRMKRKKVDVNV